MKRNPEKDLIQIANKRVTFKQPVRVKDGEGGFTIGWTFFLPRWAAVLPIRALQKFEFKTIKVEATHYIKTRGYLGLPDSTKWVGSVWGIEWSGLTGSTVEIDYKIGAGSFVEITSSTENNNSYSWTVPTAAVGENVTVRVTDNDASDKYVDSASVLVVPESIIDRDVNTTDRIFYGSREFEILSIEDIREENFTTFITCKELI